MHIDASARVGSLPAAVMLDKGVLKITPIEKSTPPEAEALATRLDAMLPRIRITDLLSEVARWPPLGSDFPRCLRLPGYPGCGGAHARYRHAARYEPEGRAHPAEIRADQLRPGALGAPRASRWGIDRRYYELCVLSEHFAHSPYRAQRHSVTRLSSSDEKARLHLVLLFWWLGLQCA